MNKQFWNEGLAGLTIFFSISYIAFTNPIILSPIGVPTGAAFFGTCLVAGLGSIICGIWAKTPTAMAPGMAFNVFVVSYAKQMHLDWPALLLWCTIAGVIMFMMSVAGLRQSIIKAIPVPLRLAVVGGIGAILTNSAIKSLQQNPALPVDMSRLIAFGGGLIVIVLGYIVLRAYAEKIKENGNVTTAEILDLVGRSSLLISIFVTAGIAHVFNVTDNTAITDVQPVFLLSRLSALQFSAVWTPAAIPLLIFLIYMLTADIAGTPFQLLDQGTPDREKRIKRSFIVDSLFNIVGPLFCTSPTVYYAENNAAKVIGGRTGAVAVWTGIGFLALLVFGMLYGTGQSSFFEFLPQVAVAPVLFCVGLLIIGAAIGRSDAEAMEDGAPLAWSEGDSLPAAITIVLTPMTGLEYGLAAGLVAYFAYYFVAPAKRVDGLTENRTPLVVLFLLAIFAVVIKLMVLPHM